MGKISVKEGMKEGLRKVHVFGGWVCVGVGWGGVGWDHGGKFKGKEILISTVHTTHSASSPPHYNSLSPLLS